ncbi:allophanate hydrolase subunit 1 [uncultured Shimia sp.]|uniref:5-oxoprolinase subunit B family protein n=1 Tax=uncultured Shimia sp. TaxID=573152 RepID=UPI0026208128|nr:allophanate hydrolase subunit 1 [uncultured Shimia sp.]
MTAAVFKPVADHAVLVQLGDQISDDLTARVQALDRAINAQMPQGVQETIPAFVNLLVEFDPLVTDHARIEAAIRPLLKNTSKAESTGRTHEVEVCYDGDDLAPDLMRVAEATGQSVEAAINMHLAAEFSVGMYGFAPGYAYLSGLPEKLQVPRKPAAVRDIAAGSVLIAGPQCLVTTLKMPTGWSIIGRSATRILRDDPARPFPFDVGDRVKFVRIDRSTLERAQTGGER